MNCIVFIYVFLIVNVLFESLRSECCRTDWTTHNLMPYCANGRFRTGMYCANGPCNMFGCNCDGGCITRDVSWIRGDIVGCRRVASSFPFPYIHTFVYVGNGRVIEAVPNKINNGSILDQLNDGETDFCTVMNEMFFDLLKMQDIPFTLSREIISLRAESVVDKHWPYDFLDDNCQHFVSYILTNTRNRALPGVDIMQRSWNLEISFRNGFTIHRMKDNSAYPVLYS